MRLNQQPLNTRKKQRGITLVIKMTSPIGYQIHSEAEREILRMLIGTNNAERKAEIIEHTCADMFRQKEYRELYNTALSLYKQKKVIDVQSIIEESGKEQLKKLAVDVNKEYITSGNYRYYCEKLHRDFFKQLYKEAESNEDFLTIQCLQQKYSFKKATVKLGADADELIVDYYNKWGTAIQTYYPSIDKALGTLQGGDFLVLAGATGMGKTCMALNLLMNMVNNGKQVLLFSLEMPLKQLQNRIISAKTGIEASKIRNFLMTDIEQQRYKNYIESEEFTSLNINVCTEYNITVDRIRRITEETEPDIVFIDYLGLVSSDINGNSYERVSQVS
jgi:replicative DNA helicase